VELISKQQARLFKARWKVVNDIIIDEIRATSPQVRMTQLMAIFDSGAVPSQTESSKEAETVRARWAQLKAKLHA